MTNKSIRIYIDTFLVLAIASYLSRLITIPEFTVPNDIVINPIFKKVDVLTNYLRFLIVLILGSISCYFSYANRYSISEKILNFIRFFGVKKLSYFSLSLLFIFLLLLLKGSFPLFSKLTGSIGESEFWGYLPTLNKLGPSQLFTVHGGIDLFPSLISMHIFGFDKTIIGTRLIIFYLIPAINLTLTYLIIYYSFIRGLKNKYKVNLSLIVILTLFFLDNYLFTTSFQDLFFLINLLFLQIGILENKKNRFSIPFFIVGSVSLLGLFYTFDRGIYILALNSVFLLTILFTKPINFKRIYASFFIGFFTSAIFIISFFGIENLKYFLENIKFLLSTGKYCCVVPSFMDYIHSSSNYSIFRTVAVFSINLSLLIFIVFFNLKNIRLENIKKIINNKLHLITILISQLLFYRIVIYLNDQTHLLQSFLMTPVLISYVLIFYLKKIRIGKVFLISFFVIFFISKGGYIKSSLINYYDIGTKFKNHNDSELYMDLINAKGFKKISGYIKNQECLYTLTNNLTWNYIFNKPHCSKYHYNFINLSKKSQEETIYQLKKKKPNYILFESSNPYSNLQYGVSTKSMNYLIYDYVLSSYEPSIVFKNNWFWKIKSNQNYKVDYSHTYKGNLSVKRKNLNLFNKLKTISGISRNVVDFSNISDLQIQITLQDLDKNIYAIIVKSENDEILSGKLLNLKNEAIVGVPFQKLKIGENKMKIFLINKENELHFFRDFSYNHTK